MKPKAPFIYLNVENQRTSVEVGGWKPEKMGLSVAAVLRGHQLRIFTEQDIHELADILNSARCVVGYNILGFDFRVLEGYAGVNLKKEQYLDLFQDIGRITGSRFKLCDLQKGTLNTESRISGLEAMTLWRDGKLKDVIEDCCNTVLTMQALHEYGRANGAVLVHVGTGKRRKRIAVKW